MYNQVLVIGAGGTGSYLIPPLARFLNSRADFTGKLIIADADTYNDTSNVARQEFAISKAGMNKAEYQYATVATRIPDFAERVDFIPEYLSAERIKELVTEGSVVITCVDNNACRLFVEQAVADLQYAAHIAPGNEMFNGQVHLSLRYDGEWATRSLLDINPALADANDDRSAMDCQTIAELPSGGQMIMANFMAAALSLNFVGQLFETHITNRDGFIAADRVSFDVSNNSFDRGGIKRVNLEKALANV